MSTYRCKGGHAPEHYRRDTVGDWRCRACRAEKRNAQRATIRAQRAAGAAYTPPPPPPEDVEILEELPPICTKEVPPIRPEVPSIHTSRTRGEAYLVISDLQIPFEHPRALRFCLELAREYNVAPDAVYCVGDEVDFHAFSRFPVEADATYSAAGELQACRERLAAWYGYFPDMKVCLSNHGNRILKKAAGAQLPSQLIRSQAEILGAPPGWRWADSWQVRASKHPFQVVHGHEGGQSVTAQRTRSLLLGRSTVWGHLHASPGIHPAQTMGQSVWGCCAGSLIDRDAYAFRYNKGDSFRPWIGCAVIKDGGLVPILEPLQ